LIIKNKNGFYIDLNVYDRVYFSSLWESKSFIDMNYANIIYKEKNEFSLDNNSNNNTWNISSLSWVSVVKTKIEKKITEKYLRDFSIWDSWNDIKTLQLFLSKQWFWPENINKSWYFWWISLEWVTKYLKEDHWYNLKTNYVSKTLLNKYFQ
jgi:hypothetical protein